MASAKLTVPLLLEWKDIEAYMAQHDIVQVIRCRDCKWFEGIAEYGNCFNLEIRAGVNDYCSFAERKEADEH